MKMDRAVGIGRNNMKILSDNEFVSMVEKWGNSRLDQMFLDMRREGSIQLFDDNSCDGVPLIVQLEETN